MRQGNKKKQGGKKLVRIRELRAHHIKEYLFLYYVRRGSILKEITESNKRLVFDYPVLVTADIDDICRKCLPFPAINYCKGQVTRLDLLDAEILGLNIGQEHTERKLRSLFREMTDAMGIKPGTDLGLKDRTKILELFYEGRELPIYHAKKYLGI